jgi:hypothetical protein
MELVNQCSVKTKSANFAISTLIVKTSSVSETMPPT